MGVSILWYRCASHAWCANQHFDRRLVAFWNRCKIILFSTIAFASDSLSLRCIALSDPRLKDLRGVAPSDDAGLNDYFVDLMRRAGPYRRWICDMCLSIYRLYLDNAVVVTDGLLMLMIYWWLFVEDLSESNMLCRWVMFSIFSIDTSPADCWHLIQTT